MSANKWPISRALDARPHDAGGRPLAAEHDGGYVEDEQIVLEPIEPDLPRPDRVRKDVAELGVDDAAARLPMLCSPFVRFDRYRYGECAIRPAAGKNRNEPKQLIGRGRIGAQPNRNDIRTAIVLFYIRKSGRERTLEWDSHT